MTAWGESPAEPWIPEPPDADPVCSVCGSPAWDDRLERCGACGATIETVAETLAR